MSDYDAEPLPEPEPVASANEVEEAEASEAEASEAAEASEVEEEANEVEVEASEVEVETSEEPVEEAVEPASVEAEASEAAEEEPVASEAVEPEEEDVVSEAVEPEEDPVVSEATEPVPVEQVASEIREILTPVESANEVEASSVLTSNDNLCSLKTLVDVLGKWSGNEIRRRQVEDLLKEGSEVDENLDDIEKVVEVLQLWIQEGGSTFREHNYFKNLDEYTLVGESRELSEEKKVKVLKTLTELVVNVSQRRVDVNNIYSIFL